MALNIISHETHIDDTNVYLDDTISITFDLFLDETTFNDSTVLLYKLPEYQRYGIDIEVEDTILHIKPTTIFLQNTDFEIVLMKDSDGIASVDPDYLDENYVLPFTTGVLLNPVVDETPDENQDKIENVLDIADTVHKDTQVVVPDVDLAGGLQPFLACEPTGSSGSGSGETGETGELITNTVYVINSNPIEYGIGITDISTIELIWNEDVLINNVDILTMSSQSLIPPIDVFQTTDIVSTSDTTVVNNIVSRSFTSEDTTNREYTATVRAGLVTSTDATKANLTYNLIFSGILEPVLCSVEQVKANAGMWNVEFSNKDYYYYYKLLHKESIAIIAAAGYDSISEITETTELIALSKYVCCVVAMYMLVYGSPSGGSVNQTFGTYVKKRDLPGFSITYDMLSSSATENSPTGEIITRLRECLKANAPSTIRDIITDTIPKPIHIEHGIKSVEDPSRPIRRRN